MLQRVKTFGSLAPSDKEWESYRGSSGYIIVGVEDLLGYRFSD